MASYKVEFKKSAKSQLRKLPQEIIKRIASHVDQLEQNPFPHGIEKVRKYQDPILYRIRVGDYRILYTVDHSEKTITVCGIGHRREIYR